MHDDVKNCIGKSSEHIIDTLSRFIEADASSESVTILRELLKSALNKELIDNQKKYQKDSVRQMRWLVVATWALVIVTLSVVLIKH